jgi:hypothetical protein
MHKALALAPAQRRIQYQDLENATFPLFVHQGNRNAQCVVWICKETPGCLQAPSACLPR